MADNGRSRRGAHACVWIYSHGLIDILVIFAMLIENIAILVHTLIDVFANMLIKTRVE